VRGCGEADEFHGRHDAADFDELAVHARNRRHHIEIDRKEHADRNEDDL
jgi:hypothetical protein